MATMHTLTHDQRSALVVELERSQQLLLDAGRGLTPAQLAWKPAPDAWSIAECLEHVGVVEKLLGGRLQRMAAAEPVTDARLMEDARVVNGGRSRENKRQAPEMAKPKGGTFTTLEEFETHFTPLRAQTIEFVRMTEAPLHALVEPHPAMGDLSGHQWLLFLSAHCERHAEQAREVRSAPNFPPSDVAS
jgi:hypothetical protein